MHYYWWCKNINAIIMLQYIYIYCSIIQYRTARRAPINNTQRAAHGVMSYIRFLLSESADENRRIYLVNTTKKENTGGKEDIVQLWVLKI